jgi:hypothetical protein
MRKLIVTFFLISVASIYWGQRKQNELIINKIIHDFEVVFDNNGLLTAEFMIVNPTHHEFYFVGSTTSCGCTVLEVPERIVLPKDTLFLTAFFDPKGSEKKTTKSLTVKFVDEYLNEQIFYLNLTAIVITQNEISQLKRISEQQEKNVAYYYQQKEHLESFNSSTSEYKKFIKQATKTALFDGKVNLLITIYNPEEKYAFEKVLKVIYKKVSTDLQNEGIPEMKIIFENPVVELSSDDSYIQLSIIETVKDIEKDVLKSVSQNKNQIIQNLPVYIQYFKGGVNDLDSNAIEYNHFITELKEKIDSTSSIRFLVFNSASHAPSATKLDNSYIVNKRQQRTKKRLEASFKDTNINELISYKNVITGPKYSERFYFPQYYYNFQYVKIIPYFVSKDSALAKPNLHGSFEHNFSSENEWIPSNTTHFITFLDQLIYQIETHGYANIILEGSSSKIPSVEHRNNDVLAYQRIKELKRILEYELYKKGINPLKLNIVEERTIVQGPPYDLQKPKSDYFSFQYVRVFMVD